MEKKHLVVKYTGIHSVEDYIMARYQMYWQVYFHPVARSYETIFIQLFSRLKDIYLEKPEYFNDIKVLTPYLGSEMPSVEQHYKLDESSLLYCCMMIVEKEDEIASDLARRLLDRDLFGYEDDTEENRIRIKKEVVGRGLDPKYYIRTEEIKTNPYSPYKGQKILIENANGEIVELEKASTIVDAITKGEIKQEGTIFFPK